jgi:parallel beta-helix repeat protein
VTVSNNIVNNNDKALNASTNTPTCAGSPDFEQEDCGEAIHLDGVQFSTVSNNTVKKNAGGILLTDETNQNSGNLVNGNDVEDNVPDCGITLPSHPPAGAAANIGVRSFGVSQNTVANNISKSNGGAGVGLFTPTDRTSSRNNLIVGNTLMNNVLPGVTLHCHGAHENLGGNRVISNIISSNGADPSPGPGENDGPVDSTGIEVYADVSAEPIDIDIAGNTISKETNSIWVGSLAWDNCPDSTPCYTPLVHLNNLLMGTLGVDTGTAAAIQVMAPENFWGCPKGPGQPKCTATSGNVTSSPFLIKPSKLP